MKKYEDQWASVVNSPTKEIEAQRLSDFMEGLRSAGVTYTLSLTTAGGAPVPVAQWNQQREPLVVTMELDKLNRPLTLKLKGAENIGVLLRE